MHISNIKDGIPYASIDEARKDLSLKRLRRRLARARKLPKDEYLASDFAGLPLNRFRYRDRNFDRAALHALVGRCASPDELQFAVKQCNCRTGSRCRTFSCFVCKQKYWRSRRKLLGKIAKDCAPAHLSWCTVVIGLSQVGFPILEDMMKSAKAEIFAALARFPSLGWSGRFEVDYLDPQIQKLGGWKERTLFALGWVKADEMATLLLHVHFVLVHRRTRRETISYQLKKVFPAPQQVRVSPLRTNLPLDVSLDNMVRYPLKPSLDPGFLAEKGAENHLPRRPDVVRYFLRMYDALDGRRKPRGMEFDKIPTMDV